MAGLDADILEATFDAESFDAVVALFVLTHIPTAELPGLLDRISAWLRPGGAFLATFSGAGAQHDEIEDDWLGVVDWAPRPSEEAEVSPEAALPPEPTVPLT